MDYKVENHLHPYVFEDIKTITESNINWPCLCNKTVLITGGNGFIAFYLVCAMLIRNDIYGSNIKIKALVRSRENAEKKYGELIYRDDLELIVQDVCTPFEFERADFVIHAASQASAYYFENDPAGTIDANLTGTANVLEYAKKSNAESTLIVSSLKVYGSVFNGKNSIGEDDLGYIDIDSYKNCYAQGKRAAETLGCCYAKQYGMNVKIARPAYIYGPASIDDDRVWAQFIANVVRKQNILLKSNGAALRSFCYVTDTAVALLKILLDGENTKPYNIANPKSDVTIRGFAKTAVEAFPELNLTLSFANSEDEKEPVPSSMAPTPEILDATRLNNIGWSAKVDLTEGIKRSVKIMSLQIKD
ncbi:NAD(P)-dependent oxidoreductase [uncultured Ruminococcus sp.]|uniref:NAD-dependent epimerase/dehydratase family protein n=1 Tax=uncultured Ruminococcus sp. TaxID=165186 RepID=UPI0025D94F32|nr:NAD-dependent epimerase/dehydratase family protein [uncultured Ruminococcus sp.]